MQLPRLLKYFLAKLKKTLIILAPGLILFAVFLFFNNYFNVKSIDLVGEKKIMLLGLDDLRNQNLFLLNETKTQNLLTKSNPGIRIINVEKVFPSKIKIYFRTITALAQFKVNGGFLMLSEDGQIIKKTKISDKNLTLINYYQQFDYSTLEPGEKMKYKDLLYSLDFIKNSLDLGLKPDTIDIKDINMIASNIDDRMILFSAEKDLATLDYEFTTMMKKFKIEGKNFKVLDLRFDKPIVKF